MTVEIEYDEMKKRGLSQDIMADLTVLSLSNVNSVYSSARYVHRLPIRSLLLPLFSCYYLDLKRIKTVTT
jgi:hypothetical protein